MNALDSKEDARDILRQFSRKELLRTMEDHIDFCGRFGEPCDFILDKCKEMTDEQLRKTIFEKDFPGHKWRGCAK